MKEHWERVLGIYSYVFLVSLGFIPVTAFFAWLGLTSPALVASSTLFTFIGLWWTWQANNALNTYHRRIRK